MHVRITPYVAEVLKIERSLESRIVFGALVAAVFAHSPHLPRNLRTGGCGGLERNARQKHIPWVLNNSRERTQACRHARSVERATAKTLWLRWQVAAKAIVL